MSDSCGEPDIYLKDLKLEVGEAKIKCQGGKMCSGQEGEQIDMKQFLERIDNQDVEAERRWIKGIGIQFLIFCGAVGLTLLITGVSLSPTGVAYRVILGASLFVIFLGIVFAILCFVLSSRVTSKQQR